MSTINTGQAKEDNLNHNSIANSNNHKTHLIEPVNKYIFNSKFKSLVELAACILVLMSRIIEELILKLRCCE